MEIQFREFNPFNCWIWLHFDEIPPEGAKNYLEGVLDSWYVIGRLGRFDSANLQANEQGSDLSWMNYDNDAFSNNIAALMHNVGQLEYNNNWARFWIDFGTSDSIAIDVLINTLRQIDSDIIIIKQMLIGGVNNDWDVDVHPDAIFS